MKGRRYTDEFKKEAVKQVTDREYSFSDVAKVLGTATHSLYPWLKKYGEPSFRQADKADLTLKNPRLKADVRRMAVERKILRWPKSTMPTTPGKVRLHS
jgi:transposase